MAKLPLKTNILVEEGLDSWYGTMEAFLKANPGDRRVQAVVAALRNQTSKKASIPHGDGTVTTVEIDEPDPA